MADTDSTNATGVPQTPDGLSELARRLRNEAGKEPLLARRDDMIAAADVLDQIVSLHQNAEAGEQATVDAVLKLIGGADMAKNVQNARVALDLPYAEAMALAQLVKRLGCDDAERLSSRYDGGAERDAMLAGIGKLQRALAEAGYAPR